VLWGCAAKEEYSIETDKALAAMEKLGDQRNCTKNFTLTGSEARGGSYRSHDEFQELPRKKAMQNIIAYMFSQGWTIFNTDTDLGVVSATTDVTLSGGRVAQFSVVITEQRDGATRVECSTSAGVNQQASEDILKREFCRLIEAAAD
jgi:hypothetical protein